VGCVRLIPLVMREGDGHQESALDAGRDSLSQKALPYKLDPPDIAAASIKNVANGELDVANRSDPAFTSGFGDDRLVFIQPSLITSAMVGLLVSGTTPGPVAEGCARFSAWAALFRRCCC